MVDEPNDDSSHYEISITAGQAFLGVVLLLASLAAAFAFGLVVGESRGEARVVTRRQPLVIEEGRPGDRGRIIELGVEEEIPRETEPPTVIEEREPQEQIPPVVDPTPPATPPVTPDPRPPVSRPEPEERVPHFAQLLSTTERAPAETLAARLIDEGFSAYVERVPRDEGMLYRVRVRFDSEASARAAEPRLRAFAPGEVWISRAE
jgi:cell division septation protein DedD